MGIETTSRFKSNLKKVKEGDLIEFTQKGFLYKGKVTSIREMTVIVEVNPNNIPKTFAIENNLTVVNHGNYKILEKQKASVGKWFYSY